MRSKQPRQYSFFHSYFSGEALIGVWNFVGKGIAALNILLIIGSLDVFKYGVYILVLAFYSFVAAIPFKLLATVITNDLIRYEHEGERARAKRLFWEAFSIRMGFAAVLALGTFFSADIVAHFYDQDIANLVRTLSPLFIFDALYSSIRPLFQMHARFGLTAFRPIVYKTIKFGILGGFVLFATLGVQEVLLAHVIATGLATFIFLIPLVRMYRLWSNVQSEKRFVLFDIVKKHGKWSVLSQVSSQAAGNLRPWLIKLFVNTEAVALFSVAESLYGAIKTFFPTETLVSLVPRELKDKRRSMQLLLRGIKYLTILGILLALLAGVVVPLALPFVFPEYTPSVSLFIALLPALVLLGVRSMSSTFLSAMRRQKYLFLVNSVKTLSTFILPLILLPVFGIHGMPFERVLTAVLVTGMFLYYLIRYHIPKSELRILYTLDAQDKEYFRRFRDLSIGYLRSKLRRSP